MLNAQHTPQPLFKKLVRIPTIAAVLPFSAILLLTFVLFQAYFSTLVNNSISKVLKHSEEVSRAYLDEHSAKILRDAKLIADDINDNAANVIFEPVTLRTVLETYSSLKDLNEAVIFVPSKGVVIAKTSRTFALNFDFIPKLTYELAEKSEAVLVETSKTNKVRAMIRLPRFINKTYLLIGRYVDPKIIEYISESENAIISYQNLTSEALKLRTTFFVTLGASIVFALLASQLLSRYLAHQITRPVKNLVDLTEAISTTQNLYSLDEKTPITEFNSLIDSFNLMVKNLFASQKSLAEGIAFTDSILSSSPVGLLVTTEDLQRVRENKAASALLGDNAPQFLKELGKTVSLKDKVLQNGETLEEQIAIQGQTFVVRTTRAELANATHYLIIVSDITEHLAYERNLLWIDVAKRLTHELKNPLTPIILSIDMIELKFFGKLASGNEQFERYFLTIKRHAERIDSMINEFIEFGNLPKVIKAHNDIVLIVAESLASALFDREATYTLSGPRSLYVKCDAEQISRAILNIAKNACEAMDGCLEKTLCVEILKNPDFVSIKLTDSGPGFPEEILKRAGEPFASTKARGSGLGLAIASKAIQEHGGKIVFANAPLGGGVVEVRLPV